MCCKARLVFYQGAVIDPCSILGALEPLRKNLIGSRAGRSLCLGHRVVPFLWVLFTRAERRKADVLAVLSKLRCTESRCTSRVVCSHKLCQLSGSHQLFKKLVDPHLALSKAR
jgi:hypothetical protein